LIGRTLAAAAVVALLLRALPASLPAAAALIALRISLRIGLTAALAGRLRAFGRLFLAAAGVALLRPVRVLVVRFGRTGLVLAVLAGTGLAVLALSALLGLAARRSILAGLRPRLSRPLRIAALARRAFLLPACALVPIFLLLAAAGRRGATLLLIGLLRWHRALIAAAVRRSAGLGIFGLARAASGLFRTLALPAARS
jgi:hypothetical protein